jgi:hypothetical protein
MLRAGVIATRVMAGHRADHPSGHRAATDGRDEPGHDDEEGCGFIQGGSAARPVGNSQ